MRAKGADVRIVGVEPAEAPYYRTGEFQPHRIPGVVPGFTPENYDPSLIDEIVDVPADAAWETVRQLAQTEGFLTGISSGATVWAARELAGRAEFAGRLIVCIVADTGQRYLSTEGLFE
jgi:cysteine synthase A